MDVKVSVRHFELNDEIRKYAVDAVDAAFADFNLKISGATVVLDKQKNQIKATLTVAIKNNPINAESSCYDTPYKAIDEVVDKCSIQARKHLDKMQNHRTEGLKVSESRKGEETATEQDN